MTQVVDARPTPESVLARHEQARRARLRIYIGAAPGVGKTYHILEDAHQLKRQGSDIVIGFIEPHGRAEDAELRLVHARTRDGRPRERDDQP